jgi:hypothetical protein
MGDLSIDVLYKRTILYYIMHYSTILYLYPFWVEAGAKVNFKPCPYDFLLKQKELGSLT